MSFLYQWLTDIGATPSAGPGNFFPAASAYSNRAFPDPRVAPRRCCIAGKEFEKSQFNSAGRTLSL
jgi:hypothetical protein